eukprot:354410-Chlamydomonas_euryale.AAC.2
MHSAAFLNPPLSPPLPNTKKSMTNMNNSFLFQPSRSKPNSSEVQSRFTSAALCVAPHRLACHLQARVEGASPPRTPPWPHTCMTAPVT